MSTVTTTTPTVIVIDDDPALREALGSLFRSVGRVVLPTPSAGQLSERGSEATDQKARAEEAVMFPSPCQRVS